MISKYGFMRRVSAMGCLLIVFLLALMACTKHVRYDKSLTRADSLMNMYPDSALAILDSMEQSTRNFTQSDTRRWQLLRLVAHNKLDTVFRSDSLQLILTEYFDKHGTPNERMMAYYLLGRAKADMGESPEAIRAYQKAVECADTTAHDCDLRTLCAILGQEAAIFDIQQMPRQQIEALQQYSHFAKKDGRIYDYIRGHELQLTAWYALDDTARCFRLTEDCHRMYLENGMEKAAASVYPTAILILLRDSQYARARTLMQAFEGKSGLFDSKGNIEPGREHYYNSKGKYYNGTNQLDSAECFYRKLAKYEYAHNYNAYLGLMDVYRKRGVIDSVSKYSMLAERALDSIQAESQADALALAVSSFNYARNEELAREKTMEAEGQKRKAERLKMALLMAFLIASCGFFFFRSRKNRVINRKIQEIELLQNTIIQMEEGNSPSNDQLDVFEKSDIVKRLKQKAMDIESAGVAELAELRNTADRLLPVFIQSLGKTGYELQSHETNLCILIKAGFRPSEIATLMNLSPQAITNLRARLNKKMFHTDKGAKDFNEKIINLTS